MPARGELGPLGPLTEFDQFNKDIFPGFTIIERLGKGASGIVFSAEQKRDGELVALKVFYMHLCKNREFVHRLMREADMIKTLDHPNVVRGFGYFKHEGYYCNVMEYVRGETLADLMKRKGVLDEKEAAKIILDVARALEAADERKVIHRDVKPSNIILTEEGVAKLTDFGLAKEQVDTSLTQAGLILGTPLYVSPEQARGEFGLDVRSDIYSLGITLYAAVTGRPPFAGFNTSLVLTKKITDDIPSPRRLNQKLSKEICGIICRMCMRERERRYPSARELVKTLELFLSGEFEEGETIIFSCREEESISPEALREIIRETDVDDELKRLILEEGSKVRPRVLKKGDILFYEQDDSRKSYLLLEGRVEILKAGRRVARVDQKGSFIGEMSPLLQAKRSATVRADARTILVEIPEDAFKEFLRLAPAAAMNLARNLALRLQNTTDQLKIAQGQLASIREYHRLMGDEFKQ